MTDVSGVTVTSAAQFIQQLSSLSGGGIPGWTLPGTNGAAIANFEQFVSAGLANGTLSLTVPAPSGGTVGTPMTPSQKETVFLTFMAGVGGLVGEAIAGPGGGLVGMMIGTGSGIGIENYSQLPLSVQLGVNPYAPQ